MGVPEKPELGNGQSIILDMSKKRRFDPDSPIGVVLNYANHSLYYMAMWMKDIHIGMIEDDDSPERYLIQNGMVGDFNKFLRDVCSVNIELSSRGDELMVVREQGMIPYRTSVSRGTMILCRLYVWLRRCKDRNALIFFDDFDDMFHYRTAENAIKAVISQSRAQCIFVTHNTGLASNDFLRPDCCFLMDNGRLSSFASLTDKDIRRGHNLEKMLREGEFDRPVD
ncbi:MAG: AAA family ATPase [Candidatus Methanomethylophilaceae archaeon]|nr:AAA family ATPase [Candidatus Methanomethylophilaceae archaeon]